MGKPPWLRWRGKPKDPKTVGLRHGFRSGLEEKNAAYLKAHGQPVLFERIKIEYVIPATLRRYTPDFELANGIIVETKGRFEAVDRAKHLYLKLQHPELDIRFVFTNPNQRLAPKSPTTYAQWCEMHGFKYAKLLIPVEWMQEGKRAGELGPRTIPVDTEMVNDLYGISPLKARSHRNFQKAKVPRPSGLTYARPPKPYKGKGNGLPRGVHPTATGRFRACGRAGGKQVWIGSFATPEQASEAYQKWCNEHGQPEGSTIPGGSLHSGTTPLSTKAEDHTSGAARLPQQPQRGKARGRAAVAGKKTRAA